MTRIVESRITCYTCGTPIIWEGGEWVGGQGCLEPGGHWTGCTRDMGLMTDCGDEATDVRDGQPLCPDHAGHWDWMERVEAYLDAHPEAFAD